MGIQRSITPPSYLKRILIYFKNTIFYFSPPRNQNLLSISRIAKCHRGIVILESFLWIILSTMLLFFLFKLELIFVKKEIDLKTYFNHNWERLSEK